MYALIDQGYPWQHLHGELHGAPGHDLIIRASQHDLFCTRPAGLQGNTTPIMLQGRVGKPYSSKRPCKGLRGINLCWAPLQLSALCSARCMLVGLLHTHTQSLVINPFPGHPSLVACRAHKQLD